MEQQKKKGKQMLNETREKGERKQEVQDGKTEMRERKLKNQRLVNCFNKKI